MSNTIVEIISLVHSLHWDRSFVGLGGAIFSGIQPHIGPMLAIVSPSV